MIFKNIDVIVKSKTGSGKTASFVIPICEKINIEENKCQALILTPTRELSVQVKQDVDNIGRFKKVRSVAVFGKQPFNIQTRQLKQRVHVVVGTPGRLLDHIKRGTLDVMEVKYLVIDEADEMLNMGFIKQVEDIIKTLPKCRNTMLFSATISDNIKKLCNKYMKNPKNIEVTIEKVANENIEHRYYESDSKDKFSLLNNILIKENPDSCIIFCNTKKIVEDLSKKFKDRGYPSISLHGSMMQNHRLDVMDKFKMGEVRFLIATDIAARGIDIDSITHVINFDIPLEKESYVHRSGRTGRADKKGKCITIVTLKEHKFLQQIEEYVGFELVKEESIRCEKIRSLKKNFMDKINSKPNIKIDKSSKLNEDITKIYIGAGKKKKIRPGDIVGAITSIEGIEVKQVGIIDIQDNVSYVDILDGKGNLVLKELKNKTIKGKKVKVEKALK